MNNLNIFILVFLSFALINCGSSSSEEIEALKQITLDEKLHGNALDRLMRDDGVDKLSEIGVDVRFVNR